MINVTLIIKKLFCRIIFFYGVSVARSHRFAERSPAI